MRRSGLCVIVFALNLFAFSNLTFTPGTISMGESSVLTGDFSVVGDSADILLILDISGDGIPDENVDHVIYNSKEVGEKFIDGDDDQDTIADGKASLPIETGGEKGFDIPGTYFIILSDKGGPDTASLIVNTWPVTNTYISGKVSSDSGGIKNIIVYAAFKTPELQDEFERIVSTDANGDYIVYLPDTMQGKDVKVGAEDEFGVLEGTSLIPPHPAETTVTAGLTTINFIFERTKFFIAGVVKDESGSPIAKARLWFQSEDLNMEFGVEADSLGKFIAPVKDGIWEIHFDDKGSSVEYMSPDVKVEVLPGDDTVDVVYVLLTADATISGTIVDSAGIDLEEDFDINVAMDTTGQWNHPDGVWYYARADISEDGSFEIPVSSKFLRYMVHTWVNEDVLPQGYFVSPSYIDSAGPGQSDLLIEIKKGDKYVNLSVVDETNNPVANVGVELSEQYSGVEVGGQTDINGTALLQVSLGSWQIRVDDPNYMNQDYSVSVDEADDTVDVIYMVHSTDAVISGTVSGDIPEKLYIMATADHDSLQGTFIAETEVTGRGAFEINVSSNVHFPGYYVAVDRHDLPEEYIIVPQDDGGNYPYHNVAAGTDTLEFLVLEPNGSISGKFKMTFPTDPHDAGVFAVDSARGFTVSVWMKPDSTYGMKLPNGVYTVVGGYISENDTLLHKVDSIVINNNDIIINWTDAGPEIVPVVFTPVSDHIVFNLKNYPNPFRGYTNISFSTPVKGKASLKIFDLNGKTIMTLYSGDVNRGRYYFKLNADKLGYQIGAGYYIARLTINGEKRYTRNIRLIYLK